MNPTPTRPDADHAAACPPPGSGEEELVWLRPNLPLSTRFGDTYFSASGGLAESRHVFLDGNGLPSRFRPGFHIAELGFGTGLNMLATLLLWRSSSPQGTLRFTSFEAHPLSAGQIARALEAFPDVAAIATPFLEAWGAGHRRFTCEGLVAEVIVGDAHSTLPAWQGTADAWFLDGFSPAKNPQMWSQELLAELARHSNPGATFATYSAAGHVRRNLAAAGFAVHRRQGFGSKRHMSHGRLLPPPP
jgi:tRNA U34 5-methylaminomethyl-2-thiouridine-forming methyltransferase MnmC